VEIGRTTQGLTLKACKYSHTPHAHQHTHHHANAHTISRFQNICLIESPWWLINTSAAITSHLHTTCLPRITAYTLTQTAMKHMPYIHQTTLTQICKRTQLCVRYRRLNDITGDPTHCCGATRGDLYSVLANKEPVT
jgi:hypothetical protein